MFSFLGKSESYYKRGWEDGFSAGMLKSWDSMLPLVYENFDKLKQKMKEDAITEALKRLNLSKETPNASNKK